jgi:hypothetical protein
MISTVLPVHVMKTCRGEELCLYLFLPSTINEDQWSSRHGRFTPGKEPIEYDAGFVPEPVSTLGEGKNNFPHRDSNLSSRDLVSIQTKLSLLRWPRSSARLIHIICNITLPYTQNFVICTIYDTCLPHYTLLTPYQTV